MKTEFVEIGNSLVNVSEILEVFQEPANEKRTLIRFKGHDKFHEVVGVKYADFKKTLLSLNDEPSYEHRYL